MKIELRQTWSKIFKFNWKFGILLILLLCVPRFILVLQANVAGGYSSIEMIMIFSPVGEELFFRDVVRGAFAKSVGEGKSFGGRQRGFCTHSHISFRAGFY
ncbi:hypothetical protein [Maribellus maritimus]|uniref:hypothetical protein n=1 Tax=Maribellus maritimus TaxID=2870838 RepID=UPI001EEB310F|nr:hypothetical protein [Maribellus maritimus]MCG6187722.1 hypothetical protein [Maribellus maritimus]